MPGPNRTCVGCRKTHHPDELIRFAVDEAGRLRVDYRRSALGRGAWLCPRGACLSRAARRNAFSRSFRRPVSMPQDTALRGQIRSALAGRVHATLISAKRAGATGPEGPERRSIRWGEPPAVWAVNKGRWADAAEAALTRYQTWMEEPSRGPKNTNG